MSQKVMITRVATVLLMGMALTGRSTMKGWFAGKRRGAKKAQEPAGAGQFEPTLKVNKAWSVNLGKGERRIGVRQGPAVANGHVFAAAITGGVHAIDLQTGEGLDLSRRRKEEAAAPVRWPGCRWQPGRDRHARWPGHRAGHQRRQRKWRARVPVVIAAPAIAQGAVSVRSNDGRITAFDAGNGTQKWFNPSELPATVRGNAPAVTGPACRVHRQATRARLPPWPSRMGCTLWEQNVGNGEASYRAASAWPMWTARWCWITPCS